jgi:hypothetical protein
LTPYLQEQIQNGLNGGDLKDLFIDVLGWDNTSGGTITYVDPVTSTTLRAVPIAHKRGIPVYLCESIPSTESMGELERLAGARTVERLIIFTDGATQLWRWPAIRRSGRTRYITHRHTVGTPQQDLVQRLTAVSFSLQEESRLTILTVRQRLQISFNADRVTSRFYDEFQKRQCALAESITGIPDESDSSWYSSLLLNRLMFLYFMQRKLFLDNDIDYLRNRLKRVQDTRGEGKFYTFYRRFLLPLFEEGLNSDLPISDPDLAQIVGSVPYLNGGIFAIHPLESTHSIDVPDQAFTETFAFFDKWKWTLDDRESSDGDEINPDILGYIFEQYVNQKQMGAYYTKEDITAYIGNATILPIFIGKLTEACESQAVEFYPWKLLSEQPENYFPPEALDPDSMPLSDTTNHAFRRIEHEQSLVALARAGAIADTDSAITANIDLIQLVVDTIRLAENPRVSLIAWHVLSGLTILDPTCGSGAFLFAALDILEELYEVAWQGVQQLQGNGDFSSPDFEEAQSIFKRVSDHPSARFFIIKQAILKNIHGVDIMPEAVEIAKLRLFLKLASLLESGTRPDPLPDLDFNIVAGNALVGSVTEIDASVGGQQFDLGGHSAPIAQHANSVRVKSDKFKSIQVSGSAKQVRKAKIALEASLSALRQALDARLFDQYALDANEREAYKPLHWYVEFFAVMDRGGFDCIVGNPPYVRLSEVNYRPRNYETEVCGDLYACVMERAMGLLSDGGRLGFIVPVSIGSVEGFSPLRNLIFRQSSATWMLHFGIRPAKLFTGAEKRLTIWLTDKLAVSSGTRIFSTSYRRWFAEERDHLFPTTQFTEITSAPRLVGSSLPKIETKIEFDILTKLSAVRARVGQHLVRRSQHLILYKRNFQYHAVFCDRPMETHWDTGRISFSTELKELRCPSKDVAQVLTAVLNSTLFFWFLNVHSDVRNLNKRDVEAFPFDISALTPGQQSSLEKLGERIAKSFHDDAEWVHRADGRSIQSLQPSRAFPIIQEIDSLVANIYGLNSDESELVANYERRVRSQELADDDSDDGD